MEFKKFFQKWIFFVRQINVSKVLHGVRFCYKRFVVRQVVKIPIVLRERRIPYETDPSPPPFQLIFQRLVLKVVNIMIS